MWTTISVRLALAGVGLSMMGFNLVNWTSPSCPRTSPGHTTSSTCNNEVCKKCCRSCCLHFHPDNTSTEYVDCNTTKCAQLPAACAGELTPGDPGSGNP
jgi:hypothetical protein